MKSYLVHRILLPITAVVLLASAMGCGMMEKPTARITGAQVQDVSLTDATMLLDVEVSNPYTVSLPMSNVDYVLSSQGQQFLSGQADVAGTVPALGSKTLNVPVRVNYLELINAVKGAQPGAKIPYRVDLGLSVNAPVWGILRMPMSKDGELAIPSGPDLLERLKDQLR